LIRILAFVLLLSGCGTMKPVEMCLKTGVLASVITLDVCGTVGDGKFDPELAVASVEEADESP